VPCVIVLINCSCGQLMPKTMLQRRLQLKATRHKTIPVSYSKLTLVECETGYIVLTSAQCTLPTLVTVITFIISWSFLLSSVWGHNLYSQWVRQMFLIVTFELFAVVFVKYNYAMSQKQQAVIKL